MIKQQKIRVAVTGLGMVSPLGNDTSSTWQKLMARQSGIAEIKSFDASTFPTRIAAEVKDFNIKQVLNTNQNKKLLKYSMPYINFGLAAAQEALLNANIKPTETTAKRWGLVAGSGLMTTDYDFWVDFQKKYAPTGELDPQLFGKTGISSISPSSFASAQTNTGVALLSQQFNIRGYTTSIHTACASGGQAIGLALQVLRRGDADYVLAGGYDSMITPFSLAGFCLLGALSNYNDTPETASRPFDLTRSGFVLGEGAAFLVLESFENAKKRGAKIYAELAGEGDSLSSYRITDSHPSGDGAIQCIESALRDANLKPEHVDYINAHGTSTKMNDFSETNAMKAVFQDRAYKIPVSSTKGQCGHLISAAGALEGAFAVLAIHHGKVPMTANLTTPDPECDLDYVIDGPREASIGVAMSNSFGFGGTNSSIIFKHPDFEVGT